MRCRTAVPLLPVVLLCLAALPASADCPLADPSDCIYVDDDCNVGTGGAGTESDPFCEIQRGWLAAATVTSPADPVTVLVMPGIYDECVVATGSLLTVPADLPTRIIADAFDPADPEASAALTTIDGTGLCPGQPTIFIGGTGAMLRGFTVTGGEGSGISGQGGVVITHNLITGNSSIVGGGIYLYTGSCMYGGVDVNASLTDNLVWGNSAVDPVTAGGDGGGIFVWARESLDLASGPCGDTTVTISGNAIEDNTISNTGFGGDFLFPTQGGGLYVLTESLLGGDVEVSVTQNTITGNSALPNTSGYGGGIWASTGGAGTETIEILENTVEGNSTTGDGGGISAWIQNVALGRHSVELRDNAVIGNQALDNGGGLDLFAFAADLDAGASLSLRANSNLIASNACGDDGGGVLAAITSERSTDDVELFPGHPSPAQEMTVSIRGNTVTDNVAGLGGGGAILLPYADSDPTGTEFLPFCGIHLPATAHIDFSNNLVAGNHALAVSPFVNIIGGGILAIPASIGEALASVSINSATVADNSIDFGFVGGIEMQVDTREDCCAHFSANACPGGYSGTRGDAAVSIDSSIVVRNDANGIGGPVPEPGFDNLTASVTYCDVFGHGNGSFQDFESTVFPGGPPPTNVSVDPQFVGGADYHLQSGSPVIDAGNPSPPEPVPDLDIDGDPRILDGNGDSLAVIDIGVDEFVAGQGCMLAFGGLPEIEARMIPHTGGAGELSARIYRPDPELQRAPCPLISLIPSRFRSFGDVAWAAERLARDGYVVVVTLPADSSPVAQHRAVRSGIDFMFSADNPWPGATDTASIGCLGGPFASSALTLTQATDLRVGAIVAWDNLAMTEVGDRGSPACFAPVGPIRVPRIPAMGQASDGCIDRADAKKGAFKWWREHEIETMQLVFAGSHHSWWGSFGSEQQHEWIHHYTLAWFDRWLKDDVSALDRLLAPEVGGVPLDQLLDDHYRSGVFLDGLDCGDLRDGCPEPPARRAGDRSRREGFF